MNWLFVDTSAWCAYFDKSDSEHINASEYLEQITSPLVTSNYIVDETLTLIRKRIGHKLAIEIGKQFLSGQIAQIIRVTPNDENSALKIFEKYSDKDFSFTDCTSFFIIERLKIKNVFAFDINFTQFGKLIVLP